MHTKPDTVAKSGRSDLLPIPHPGETLKEDFIVPLGLSAYAMAKAVGSTPITISMIVRGKRGISAEMAIRLGIYTGTGPEFWWNLQSHYELRVAQRRVTATVTRRVSPLQSV